MGPNAEARETVHRVIYDELVLGAIREPFRKQYIATMEQMVDQGAEGVILGALRSAY